MSMYFTRREKRNLYPIKNTEVHCLSPFEVTVLRRPVKHWCCLFTFVVFRTVDIGVVSGLDTDACIMANTRIMTRRSKRHIIVNYKGTIFVDAAREFTECFSEWNQEPICEQMARG